MSNTEESSRFSLKSVYQISNDLEAFRKAQHLNDKLEIDSNNVLVHLIEKIKILEDELDYYRSEQATGDFADMNGDPLQEYVK